ncbi:MAG: HAD family phosphatase [Paracoccus sp. (in: a-proteobacteria)]|nr:HAD family phosphatase [Paracoccus sp. (in: a-proteobacteria)]
MFDLDGTLIASEKLALEAGAAALADMGFTVPEGLLEAMIGRDDDAAHALLEAGIGKVDRTELAGRIGAAFERRIAAGTLELRPYAHELLDLLDASPHPLPRAVATSAQAPSATRKLAATGLAPRFAHVVTRNCVTSPKPAPEPYLRAAAMLGMTPETCLVFEDSDIGAEAARAAGMTVVQIPDLGAASGRHADFLAPDLIAGARAAGLLPAVVAPQAGR